MTFMSFICDYALIDPIILAYKVDCATRNCAFTTYEDIDEDCFKINVFPQNGVISNKAVLKIAEVINPYIFEN